MATGGLGRFFLLAVTSVAGGIDVASMKILQLPATIGFVATVRSCYLGRDFLLVLF